MSCIFKVNLRKLMVIGGDEVAHHPSHMKCFVNVENIDFTNISNYTPVEEFNVDVNADGTREILVANVLRFNTITTLTLYINSNHGNVDNVIKYIGMQGEHTHYRREAVKADYEILCSHQNISAQDSKNMTTTSL